MVQKVKVSTPPNENPEVFRCRDDDVTENVMVTTTPPEAEIEAMWTVELLSPIVFTDTEVGSSSVDAVRSEESLRGNDADHKEVSFINMKRSM